MLKRRKIKSELITGPFPGKPKIISLP